MSVNSFHVPIPLVRAAGKGIALKVRVKATVTTVNGSEHSIMILHLSARDTIN